MSVFQSLGTDDDGRSAELRLSRRTNVFLTATMRFEGRILPVRIRNMSAAGALLQAAILPAAGTELMLRRGELEASARVIWSEHGACGVRFLEVVAVPAWLSEKVTGAGEAQQRVDIIQAQVRTHTPSPPEPALPRDTGLPKHIMSERVAEEIAHVQRILEQVGDKFTSDPVVLSRHIDSLQQFDIMGQILGHLARIIVTPDPALEAEKIGMDALRARLLRKAL